MPDLDRPTPHLVTLTKAEAAVIRTALAEYVDPDEETAALISRVDARLAVMATHAPPTVIVDPPPPGLAEAIPFWNDWNPGIEHDLAALHAGSVSQSPLVKFGEVEVHYDSCTDETCTGECVPQEVRP